MEADTMLRWNPRIVPAVILLAVSTAALPLLAQEPARLDARLRTQIVERVTAALNEEYVFDDKAREMETLVKGRLHDGAYDGLIQPAEFAARLQEDLRSVTHDRHLRVGTGPPLTQMQRTVLDPEQRRRTLRRNNYAFQKVEVLEGNIGYLRFDGFVEAELAGETAVAAMNFLANVDALIIDLRYNGGGAPSMIQLISSYFFAERKHLNSFYVRATDSWEHFWTQEEVRGPKLVDVPIYILTSSRTFSAAEEFTYNLKNMKRATIVGETTGGGAHPVNGRNFDFGSFTITMSVPYGRAVNPITGTNWEGTGVTPDIAVPADQALERALQEARRPPPR
jgi:C-terminal processing protease CtpA/Prc